ncbi:MAG TPA: hypothetical protein VG204_05700 [Terriglobia bacterium]|nr:hypothetical protein [Terriglobia bacterium]
MKAEDVKVENPAKAMQNFTSLLGKLVKVPKSEMQEHRAKAKKKRARRRRRRSG